MGALSVWCLAVFLAESALAGDSALGAIASDGMREASASLTAGVIPAPANVTLLAGNFVPGHGTKIYCASAAETRAAKVLQSGLKERTDLYLPIGTTKDHSDNEIRFELVSAGMNSTEGYSLEISSKAVVLRAATDAGLFYGVQSLLQMVDARRAEGARTLQFPALRILDKPRFEWRGLMLDESRHFFGKETVEELLDSMAYLKMNRFHWHLTDEPGWRIEIKKYPKLAKVGGKGDWSDPTGPTEYYTQKDIREIVQYAQDRHIMVIPEIDMPGHATAAARAYPNISGGGTNQWAGFTFNPAREETYDFLGNVLAEVATLFPGSYIHIGGDEVHYGNQSWSTDPEIVKFTHDHGMNNSMELEQYFICRMAKVVNGLGKTTLGWDEVAGAGVDPAKTAVLWWHHENPSLLTSALEQGYPVILCPRLPCYFDFVQDKEQRFGRRWKGQFNNLTDVYNFPNVEIEGRIPADKKANVLGMEACLWTEQIQNKRRLDYMTYPRLAALAEAAWTPAAAKDSKDFAERLRFFLRELDRRKTGYFDPFNPLRTPEPPGPAKKAVGTANG